MVKYPKMMMRRTGATTMDPGTLPGPRRWRTKQEVLRRIKELENEKVVKNRKKTACSYIVGMV